MSDAGGATPGLPEQAADRDPLQLFAEWWEEARASGLALPEATALATSTPDGRPSVRMVLLRGLDARGFVFYTNYGSRKAREMNANPRAALCFHWPPLQRQVRVSGPVQRIPEAESAAYFQTRARGSRLGAWASRQSEPLADRQQLLERFAELEEQYGEEEVPLPPFWGGYRLDPESIEFWQGRPDRLHDRLLFERGEGREWAARRLYP